MSTCQFLFYSVLYLFPKVICRLSVKCHSQLRRIVNKLFWARWRNRESRFFGLNCHERGTKRQFWVPMKKWTLDSMMSKAHYKVQVWLASCILLGLTTTIASRFVRKIFTVWILVSFLKYSLGHSRSEASDTFVVYLVLNNFWAVLYVPLISASYGQLKRGKPKNINFPYLL